MHRQHLSLLVCPTCQDELVLDNDCGDSEQIDRGELRCVECQAIYPIVKGVPRFVDLENYTDGFSFQWNQHATTQHDSYSGASISRERFFHETRWPTRLSGETILEIGCGAGRFTTHALSTNATVVSVDMSGAVEMNRQLHRTADKLLVIQADLRSLPLRIATFDRLFCFGVLQHTPNVEDAFKSLPRFLRTGGQLTVDVYDKREGFWRWLEPIYRTYYWLRPITTQMETERLYRLVEKYISMVWPLTRQIGRIPRVGRMINRMLLVHDYRQRYELTEKQLKEWAILDTFDNLAPKFDQRQTLGTLRKWFSECEMEEVDVHYGYNGIEGRGVKC